MCSPSGSCIVREHMTNTKGDIHTTVRVSADVHDRLKAIAAAEHRTVSAEVRRLIELHVANHGLEAAA